MLVLLMVSVLIVFSEGSPKGAPKSACMDMTPRHKVPPQKSPAPFSITVSTTVVRPGVPMEVVISGEGPTDFIGGFLLQARYRGRPVGTFDVAHNFRLAQLLNCGTPGNALTHKQHEGIFNKHAAAFTWTPPEHITEEFSFRFRATIAKSFTVFWIGIESVPVKVIFKNHTCFTTTTKPTEIIDYVL